MEGIKAKSDMDELCEYCEIEADSFRICEGLKCDDAYDCYVDTKIQEINGALNEVKELIIKERKAGNISHLTYSAVMELIGGKNENY